MRRCTVCRRQGHTARAHAGLTEEQLAELKADGLAYLGREFRELDEVEGEPDLFASTVSGIVGGPGPTPGYSRAEAERLAEDGMTVGAHELLADLDQEEDPPVYSDVAQLNYAVEDDPAHVPDPACPKCGAVMDTVIGSADYRCSNCGWTVGTFADVGELGPQFVPWRTVLGPDEPMVITEPGVYLLTADEYHNPAITGEWMSNSDGKKLLETCPAQFKWDRDHGVRKTSDAFDFGHVAHTVVLGRGERYQVFGSKLDGRTKEGKAQKLEVDAARAAGRTPIYGDQWAAITAMAEAIRANPTAHELLTQPGRAEACLFWRDQVKVDGVYVTVQRRAMVDLLPDVPELGEPMRVIDYKTADEVAPNDRMRKKIYDYGYHRQGATIHDACRALFERVAEVVFVMQSKTAPHLVVPVDLDTPAQRIGAKQNEEALKLWARAQLTGVWPEYANGVVTSGVPAWIEHQYEDEIGAF
jgi:hypothetical protein